MIQKLNKELIGSISGGCTECLCIDSHTGARVTIYTDGKDGCMSRCCSGYDHYFWGEASAYNMIQDPRNMARNVHFAKC